MLIGVAAAELSHKKAAASATGLTGWVAYLGASAAGYPLGRITQDFGWEGFFIVLTVCGVISTVLLLPLWGVSNREEGFFGKKIQQQIEPETEPLEPASS